MMIWCYDLCDIAVTSLTCFICDTPEGCYDFYVITSTVCHYDSNNDMYITVQSEQMALSKPHKTSEGYEGKCIIKSLYIRLAFPFLPFFLQICPTAQCYILA